MKRNLLLTSASLLSILLFTFHLTDDIVHGWEPGTLRTLYALPILVLWLYGTLLLRERLSGYIIMLVGGLLSLGIPAIHMSGRGVGTASRVANTSGHHFFVWTLLMLGLSGLFAIVLAVQGLWRREWRQLSAERPIAE
ncbi:MAG: hypothetical protein JOZ44_05585 [Acidobacteria bacterium]|nr:hypothetical protein [Acidobacteriota bacterium]